MADKIEQIGAKRVVGRTQIEKMTDVVMPGMNGRDLADRLLKDYPTMKCLFMSGYTANIITNQGVLSEGMNFIQKPFSRKELAAKVRQVLENIDS